jgi:hypothetical protein
MNLELEIGEYFDYEGQVYAVLAIEGCECGCGAEACHEHDTEL